MTAHRVRLNASQTIEAPFFAMQMSIFNPINQWIYIRIGALDLPSARGADITIEPYASKSIVLGAIKEFGFVLGSTGSGSADNSVNLVDYGLFQTSPQEVAYVIFYDAPVPVGMAQNIPYPVEPFRYPIDAKTPTQALASGAYVTLIPDTSGTFAFLHPGLTPSKVITYLYKAFVLAESTTSDQILLSLESHDHAGNFISNYGFLTGDVPVAAFRTRLQWTFDGTMPGSWRQGLQLFPDNLVAGGCDLRVLNIGLPCNIATWALYELRYQP